MFLTHEELSRYSGYEPNQRRRICRFLEKRGIPYELDRLGDPVVLRSDVETPRSERAEVKLDWLNES